MASPLLFVGHAALDHVFHIERFSAVGDKAVAHAQVSRIGGMATRAALAAQRLRAAGRSPGVRLLSAVGDDLAGEQLRRALIAEGLDIDVVAGARTSVSAVLVDARGERQISNFRGDALDRAPLPALPEAYSGVLVDPRWPAAALAALTHARSIGVPGMVDADIAPAEILHALVPLATWCVFSRSGLAAWTGDSALAPTAGLAQAAKAAPGAELLVTLGAEGAVWRRPDGTEQALPAFRVEVGDTNGAGDVMHGALLLSLAEGLAPSVAVRRAMAAAALACQAGLPTRDSLDRFLENR